jgi:ABC-type lipoprotein release transport system permease subunit
VHIALGASAASVVSIVVRHAAALAALGIATGGVAAYWATSALSSLLFGVTPRDVLVFVVGGGVLLLVAIGAAWIPARRATRVPPLTALMEGA